MSNHFRVSVIIIKQKGIIIKNVNPLALSICVYTSLHRSQWEGGRVFGVRMRGWCQWAGWRRCALPPCGHLGQQGSLFQRVSVCLTALAACPSPLAVHSTLLQWSFCYSSSFQCIFTFFSPRKGEIVESQQNSILWKKKKVAARRKRSGCRERLLRWNAWEPRKSLVSTFISVSQQAQRVMGQRLAKAGVGLAPVIVIT